MANITDGNYLVYNQGNAPLVNNHFMLRVELLFDLPCKSVRTFTREMEYELIQEGGLNDYVHRRRKPNTTAFILRSIGMSALIISTRCRLARSWCCRFCCLSAVIRGNLFPVSVARTCVFTDAP